MPLPLVAKYFTDKFYFFFSVNYGWDTDEFEDTSTRSGSCRQANIKCTCQSLISCQWSQKIFQRASRLPQNHPTRNKFFKFITDRFCSNDRSVYKVYCCNGGKGTFPRDCKLKQIKDRRRKQRPGPTSRPGSNTQGNSRVRTCQFFQYLQLL